MNNPVIGRRSQRGWQHAVWSAALGALICANANVAAAACAGWFVHVGGYCWAYGAPGRSCDQVCAGFGASCDLVGTRDYAGSNGTGANCTAVLDALGAPAGVFFDDGNPGTQDGCHYYAAIDWRIRYSSPTTCGSSGAQRRRACACTNAPIATDTPTETPTVTPTSTPTQSATATPTAADTATFSPTTPPTTTPSSTPAATATAIDTTTATPTLAATATPSPADTPTSPATATVTATATESPTETPTSSSTPTATDSPSATPTATLPAACPEVPSNTCYGAGKSSLKLKTHSDPGKRKFSWKWTKGVPQLQQSDFGDPLNGSPSYTLCLYDETASVPVLRMGVSVAAGGTCGDTPCWKAIADKGWAYKSKDGNGDGITKMVLKGGAAGKPQVQVAAKGSNLPLPSPIGPTEFFDQDDALLVQLHSSNPSGCWSSAFDTTSTIRNDGAQFKAKTP